MTAEAREPTGVTAGIEDEPPLELAQVVWQVALGLAHPTGASADHDVSDADGGATLTLVRLARNDVSVLRHAVALGRGPRRRGRPADTVERAVARLDDAIALLAPGEAD